ncbi:hypothetical protein sos41_12480 [Alphaproteobacteria bacterium SO-S41]|nr:hypothetical protein sos41_12480 [Alphaproteobacteria bacterium SO-S41]
MMRYAVAAMVLTAALCGGVALAASETPAPSTVETRDDGWFIHKPSGLLLPREIYGAKYTHTASLKHVGPDGIAIDYGPITVTIGPPSTEIDLTFQDGVKADPDPPVLPALLFWGAAAQPVTFSVLHSDAAGSPDWIAFTVAVGSWRIELSAFYEAGQRGEVIKTAEAVWANLASGNERDPR